MTEGFIYILVNDAMPGIVKVGKTKSEPTNRASQLSSATGVPERFSIFRQYAVTDCGEAEKFAHRILERAFGRPNSRREFFSGESGEVSALLDEALQPYLIQNDSPIANNALAAPILRVERKEFTFAKLEFEELFHSLPLTKEKIAASASLQKAAGAYLASCFALGKPPTYHQILAPSVKSKVIEAAITFAKEFESDPIGSLIEFVRQSENGTGI